MLLIHDTNAARTEADIISLLGHAHHQAVPAVQPCLLHTHPRTRWYHTSCQALLHGVTLHLHAMVYALCAEASCADMLTLVCLARQHAMALCDKNVYHATNTGADVQRYGCNFTYSTAHTTCMQLPVYEVQGGKGLYHEHQPCRRDFLAHLLPLHHQQLHWPAQRECDEMCLQLCCSIQASPCASQLGGPHKNACLWSPIALHVIQSRIWCRHTHGQIWCSHTQSASTVRSDAVISSQ